MSKKFLIISCFFFILVLLGLIFGERTVVDGPGGVSAAIKSNLAQLREQTLAYFEEHKNSWGYGDESYPVGFCPDFHTLYENIPNNFFFDNTIKETLYVIKTVSHSEPVCAFDVEKKSWAVSARLPVREPWRWYRVPWYLISGQPFIQSFWCVDSTGASREVAHHITEAKCPEAVAR